MKKLILVLAFILFSAPAHLVYAQFGDASGTRVKLNTDTNRTTRMFTASVASTATAETLITLTFSNNLATTSTCSSCAITTAKKIRILSIAASVRNTTGTTAGTATLNLRGAVGGATTASSPLQMHYMVAIPASTVPVNFPTMDMPDGVEWDANGGTNTFGITITHPQWVTGSVVATFDITLAAYEY